MKTRDDIHKSLGQISPAESMRVAGAPRSQGIQVSTGTMTTDDHETPLQPDAINRLWQHGLHEERLL